MPATGEPIWIRCEGSGQSAARLDDDAITGMCCMCGQWVTLWTRGRVMTHQRDDIIARLKRGDFG